MTSAAVLYPELVDTGAAGHGRALAIALARNATLGLLYALALRSSLRVLPTSASIDSRSLAAPAGPR